MNKQELDDTIKNLEIQYEKTKKQLYQQYAKYNAKFRIGDIIRNNVRIIKVTKIEYDVWNEQIKYYGICYKKEKGKIVPKKHKEINWLYEPDSRYAIDYEIKIRDEK